MIVHSANSHILVLGHQLNNSNILYPFLSTVTLYIFGKECFYCAHYLPKSFLCNVFLFPCWAYTRASLAIISTNNSWKTEKTLLFSLSMLKQTLLLCVRFLVKPIGTDIR